MLVLVELCFIHTMPCNTIQLGSNLEEREGLFLFSLCESEENEQS